MERKSEDQIRQEIAIGYARANIKISPDLLEHLVKSYYDIGYFNSVVLGQPPFTYLQWQMGVTTVENEIVAIVTGNGVGKSHYVAATSLWHFYTRPDSITINTAPAADVLTEAVWSKIIKFAELARYQLPFKYVSSPKHKMSFSTTWTLSGISTNKIEKGSGRHCEHLLVLADEASGISTEIFSALDSLNYSKIVLTGNPIRTDGYFYETAMRAQRGLVGYGFLQIASTDGPHSHLERSPFGLCDKSWLRKMENQYGRNTIWWSSHIEGKFPSANEDAIIPMWWLNNLALAHKPFGPCRLGIDLATGSGGDKTVLAVRDDNGLVEMVGDNTWNLERAAQEARFLAQKYDIEPRFIVFDGEGIGHDFNQRLLSVNLRGCKTFRPSTAGPTIGPGEKWRDAALWKMRHRLDPDRQIQNQQGIYVKQTPFFIKTAHLQELRPELQGLSYAQTATGGKIRAKSKEELKKRIGHSPDYADALMLTFAYDQ